MRHRTERRWNNVICSFTLVDCPYSFSGYDCSATSCLTPFIQIGASASAVQSALCNIQGSGPVTFMNSSADGLCVTVTRDSYAINSNATEGSYLLMYTVTFVGQYLRGDVPALSVLYSNVTYSAAGASFVTSYRNSTSGAITTLGSVNRVGNVAYTTVVGNQPDGLFSLEYFCERRTVPVIVNVTAVSLAQSLITANVPALVQYEYIRILTTYHQIISVDSTGTVATISPSFDLTPYAGIFTFTDAETGAFYSDPYDTYGVSAECYTPNIYITLPMNQSDIAADMSAKLRALSPVIVDSDDSLTIVRTYYPLNSSRIGYLWTITFNRQNGDLLPMQCLTNGQLLGTNLAGGATCTISTVRNGTLIDGYFALTLSSPNAYIATPVNYSSKAVPWNIDQASLTSILSSTTGFDTVTVARTPYFPSGQIRWSGCYFWTVSFAGRYGDVPTMVATDNLTASSTVLLSVGSHNFPLTHDDPGTEVEGNQVGGYFGFSFTDTNGTFYKSSSTAFPVVSNVTGEAISAAEFQVSPTYHILNLIL